MTKNIGGGPFGQRKKMEERDLLGHAKNYSYDLLPVDRDCFLIRESEYALLIAEWCRYYDEPDGKQVEHPNSRLAYRWCALKRTDNSSYDANVCITRSQRFHGVLRQLSQRDFVTCLHFHEYGKRPYVVVTDDWANQIEKNQSSIYALIDAIDMRKFLAREGKISHEKYEAFCSAIDYVARANEDCTFLSFADSILVKSNWDASDEKYDLSYQPERIVEIANEVQEAILSSLSLRSYAVISQGTNYIETEHQSRPSVAANHLSIPSISGPFAEVYAIDDAVRKNIRSGVHDRKSFYLSESLVLSLRLKKGTADESFLFFKYEQKSLSFWWNRYVATDFQTLKELIDGI